MSKNKNARAKSNNDLHFFFYLTSIIVFVMVGVSAVLKVAADLYIKDLAIANKLQQANEVYMLPLTGSADTQFTLMVLIMALAILVGLWFMIRLNKFNLTTSSKKGKNTKKK
jgi:Na+/pantothenate symporter